jgi:hypothetical protein
MPAKILQETKDELVMEVRIPKSRDFFRCEENIQNTLNEAGCLAIGAALENFDTDGSPIIMGEEKYTAKRKKIGKDYECRYGTVHVQRYAYQSSAGGEVYIPLEPNARIIGGSTPAFAKLVSFDYSRDNSRATRSMLRQSLGREVSSCYIQDISAAVAQHVESKSRQWDYAQSEPSSHEVAFIAIGLDGTCLLFCDEGYRQAMVGTIAFYDAAGERLHTNYIGAAPEHGKATFIARMEEEIARIKASYPMARYVGISDGASDYLPWLKRHTTTQILDFWHVTEYINQAAGAVARKNPLRKAWIDQACHRLKHDHGAAREILDELLSAQSNKLSAPMRENLEAALSYFQNNLERMNYASYRRSHLPIGSGVTEAACKTLVKTRMCGSGMKWRQNGADTVLTLRALSLTDARWEEFWANVAKYGLPKLP